MSKVAILLLSASLLACEKQPGAAASSDPTTTEAGPALAAAQLGKPAPDFTLPSLDGGTVKLSDYRGKIVVLEWFNPECPFVKAAHGEGSLKGRAARHRGDGVVWLAVNSNAPGKQGSSPEANRTGKEKLGIDYPILVDEKGTVGRAYGAKHTPHMYVIDKTGVLVYRGALDNTKSGDLEDADPLVDYVGDAITATAAGKPVSTADTEAWGCSVKYVD